MSINSYLQALSGDLLISDSERLLIDRHVETIKSRLRNHFENELIVEHFPFGSFTRKTLMPRKADRKSDVDYMVVFNPTKPSTGTYSFNNSFKEGRTYYEPSTYLSWLKTFIEKRYPTSDIYTSHPTIVLELSSFKIELVPAKKEDFGSYSIPSPMSNYIKWMPTNPNSFNDKVRIKNTSENSLIRPLIRLMKYWNALNGYVFTSYNLEERIVNTSYNHCITLWEYLKTFVSGIFYFTLSDTKKLKIDRLKKICSLAKSYENSTWTFAKSSGEAEIKKAFPSL